MQNLKKFQNLSARLRTSVPMLPTTCGTKAVMKYPCPNKISRVFAVRGL
jgi:hypothetical protein